MSKTNAGVPVMLKELRALLDSRADEKTRLSIVTGQPKSPVKTIGVRPSTLKTISKEFFAKNRTALDYAGAVSLVDSAVARKTREEILVALEVLERFRREFTPALFAHLDKWSALADDLEIAEAIGSKVAAPLLALDPSKISVVKKWAKLRGIGRRRLALLAASGLVTDGRRMAAPVLEVCEVLLNEEHPVLVSSVASLLRDTTKVDAKAVQDFLFRRSIDGNPDILRAGSENLDAARRAALIAKLEAQAMTGTPLAAAGR
jgi:DNA alkylation repair enzyme